MNHQGLIWNVHCVSTVVLRKQLNFKSTVIRSERSSCFLKSWKHFLLLYLGGKGDKIQYRLKLWTHHGVAKPYLCRVYGGPSYASPPTLRPPRVKICSTAVNTSVTEIEKYLKFEKYLKIHYNIEKFACDFSHQEKFLCK